MLPLLLSASLLVSVQVRPLAQIKVIHIAAPDRTDVRLVKVAACLADKLTAHGRFAVAPTTEQADAVLHLSANVPGGSSRILLGKSPQVTARLLTRDGVQLWSGSNKYRKSTTAWGTGTELECGLANGLAKKLVAAR